MKKFVYSDTVWYFKIKLQIYLLFIDSQVYYKNKNKYHCIVAELNGNNYKSSVVCQQIKTQCHFHSYFPCSVADLVNLKLCVLEPWEISASFKIYDAHKLFNLCESVISNLIYVHHYIMAILDISKFFIRQDSACRVLPTICEFHPFVKFSIRWTKSSKPGNCRGTQEKVTSCWHVKTVDSAKEYLINRWNRMSFS